MTDRTIRAREGADAIDFAKGGGLVPVVAQEAASGEVRMVGWQDRAALDATLSTGRLHFHSRSRGTLWMKGETSGHVLEVVSLHADCDGDAILARVAAAGPTCHTAEPSCFGQVAAGGAGTLDRLDATLAERARTRPDGSYTVRLLEDDNLRLKKLGEECAELVAALATDDTARAVAEGADLLYHVLVALRAVGADARTLLAELESRAG